MSKPITAAVVREFLRDEKRFGNLSPEAQATVKSGARGRLHPQAIKAYNKGRKAGRRYELGANAVVKAEAKAAREALRASGVAVGARGPLPKVKPSNATPKA